MPREKRTFEDVRYDFDETELLALGQELARVNQAQADLEREKKDASADFGARIKAVDARRSRLARKINEGFELRPVECVELLDAPRPGVKSIARSDTGQVIRTEAMTEEEQQRSLPFEVER
ncbi:MAG TPA: hypothetical protein VGF16_16755 [Bryobacteraceae bacterium]|jgi:hypothetical protein